MRIFFILISLMVSFNGHANCRLEINSQDVKVKWLAYKTPKKVAVQGEFKKFTYSSAKADDVIGSLKDATFSVDSSSVSTGNTDRDKKIVKNFFTEDGKPIKIAGKFFSKNPSKVMAQLEIQGVSKEVSFDVDKKEDSLILSADINVLSFSLKDNLSRINLACKALHEGVTWPDVKIMIEINGKKICQKN
jgi:polyisoprenoid-binding protein YceI